MKRTYWLFFAFLFVASFVVAQADVPIQVAQGAITGTGVIVQWQLSGANTCQVKITGSPSGLTATVKTSADQFGVSGWDAATASVGSNSITTASNNLFTVASTGLVGFQVNVTGYTSGTTNYYVACSPSTVSSSGSGGSTVVTNFPSPYCNYVNGVLGGTGCLAAVPANPSGTPYSATNPQPVTTNPPYVAPTCAGGALPCVQISGVISSSTSPPYVAPTCPGVPNAPCVQITGQPTVIVSAAPTPIPNITSSPGGFQGYPELRYGTSGLYTNVMPDSYPSPVATTGTGVALIASATSTQNVYAWYLAFQATATSVGTTLNWGWGTTVSTPCDTGQHLFFPSAITGPTTAGSFSVLVGFQTGANVLAPGEPLAVPLVLPTGNNMCSKVVALTSGTIQALAVVTVH
jgi:hypothetical protein